MVDKTIRSHIKIFEMWQVWPKKNQRKLNYFIQVVLQYLLVTFPLMIGAFYHIYALMKENLSYEEILVNSVVPLTAFNIFYSTPLLAMVAHKSSEILDDSKYFSQFGTPPNHPRNLSLLTKIIDLLRWSIRIMCFLITLNGYLTQEKCKKKQLVSHLSTCGLFIDVRYPFDIQKSPYFEFFLIYQYFSICISTDIALHVASLPFAGNLALCNMLDHLNTTIYETFEDGNNIKIELKRCVKYHIHIIGLCDQQNDSFQEIVLILMLTLPIFMGIPAYVFVKTYDVRSLMIVVSWMIGLTVGPTIGQRLIDKSTAIAYTVYDVPWYEHDSEIRKTLYFMAMRAQRELKFNSTRGMYTLNFNTIYQTLSGAYSYMTLLFTLLNK